MGELVPRRLQIWEGWSAKTLTDKPDRVRAEILPLAERLARIEIFQPRGEIRIEGEPFTLPWFLGIERRRFGRHGRWIPRLLEFHKHSGESVLAVGGSLGTDWVQYARHGAEVQLIPSNPTAALAIQQQFEERKLRCRVAAPCENSFPVESAKVDVLVLNFVDTPPLMPLDQIASEAYRVLRPGGKVIVLSRAKWDIDAWWGWLPWYRHLGPRSMVDQPEQPRMSARLLAQYFSNFTETRASRRHLRRAEVPHLCRLLPLHLLERLFGRVLIYRAFKPISAALPIPLAA